jgi:hypothetical protein
MDGERPLRNAVKAFRQTGAVTDSELEREIGRALNVDPSPEFLARVRMRVAHETMPAPWRFRWLALAGAAAVVVFAVVVTFWPAAEELAPRQAVLPQSTAPVQPDAAPAPLPEPPIATAPRQNPRAVPVRAQFARVEGTPTGVPVDKTPERELPPFPEVLISADEVRAYQRLLGIVEQQRLPPPPPPAHADDGRVELHDLQLASLRIEALPPMARLEGERP